MALSYTPGYTHLSGGLVTPARLNAAITALQIAMGEKKLLGTTGEGAVEEIAYTAAGLALLQAADAAAQRAAIGLAVDFDADSNTQIGDGDEATSVILDTGPAVDVGTGVWLVSGSVLFGVESASAAHFIQLVVRDVTNNVDVAFGTAQKVELATTWYNLFVVAPIAYTGGGTLQLKVVSSVSCTMGSYGTDLTPIKVATLSALQVKSV